MLRCSNAAVVALVIAGLSIVNRAAVADYRKVDMLLVLAADISSSVDDRKFRLQRDGYAAAIAHPTVVQAMTAGQNGRIAICFVEWSGHRDQTVVIDWTLIAGGDDAQEVSGRMREAPRSFRSGTSISGAIDYSVAQLARSPYESPRHVINVSGDGDNNGGREVTQARDDALAKGVTINGLVILSESSVGYPIHTNPSGGLMAYYKNNVIGGPGAFVLEAQNFESFGRSLVGKLLKEIAEARTGDGGLPLLP